MSHREASISHEAQTDFVFCFSTETKSANKSQVNLATLLLQTIHGKSRFPGLFIWLADGRRIPVQVPDGCLLLQAGKQMEWLTAGVCKAGMHEASLLKFVKSMHHTRAGVCHNSVDNN